MTPYIEKIVLPLFRWLCRKQHGRVRCGRLADCLGQPRRTVYNWLHALALAGLAVLEGKKWRAV